MTTTGRVAAMPALAQLPALPACQIVGDGGPETSGPGQTRTGQS